jgi:hypothetical protein
MMMLMMSNLLYAGRQEQIVVVKIKVKSLIL